MQLGFGARNTGLPSTSFARRTAWSRSNLSVVEIVADHVGDTYRAVYMVKFAAAIYVLHAFQKKLKAGIKTTAGDLEMIQRRLKAAEADYKTQLERGGTS